MAFCHLRKAERRGEGEYLRSPAELKGVPGGSSEDESRRGRRAIEGNREKAKHPTPLTAGGGTRRA